MIQMSSNGSVQWIDERHIQEYVSNTNEHIIVKYDYVDICGIVWYHMLPLNRQLLKYGPLAGDSKKKDSISFQKARNSTWNVQSKTAISKNNFSNMKIVSLREHCFFRCILSTFHWILFFERNETFRECKCFFSKIVSPEKNTGLSKDTSIWV